jgi:hypothetical protein
MAITDFDSVFWTDPWLRKRTPHARYLFSYLFTGPHKNRAGLYSIDIDVISFETGMSREKIEKAMPELNPKVKYDYDNEIVFIINHVKHQFAKNGNISPKMGEAIAKDLNKLPREHPFVLEFIEVYSDFFLLSETFSIEYQYSQGKGRVREGKGKGSFNLNDAFEKFWTEYPRRNGKRVGKQNTLKRFQSLSEDDWTTAIKAAVNYANSQVAKNNYAKDPERFLKDDYWRDWIDDSGTAPLKETDKASLQRQLNEALDKQEKYDIELKFDTKENSQVNYDKWTREVNKLRKAVEG